MVASHLGVGEYIVSPALDLDLSTEPLDRGQQMHRALHGLGNSTCMTRLSEKIFGFIYYRGLNTENLWGLQSWHYFEGVTYNIIFVVEIVSQVA